MDGSYETEFIQQLLLDMKRCSNQSKLATDEDKPFWFRMTVRSFFGLVEAWLSMTRRFYLPQVMARRADEFNNSPTPENQLFLSLYKATEPNEWTLDSNGRPEEKKRKIPFKANFKACAKMLFLCNGQTETEAITVLSGDRWDALIKASKFRDGLMHPHGKDDVVFDDDARSVFEKGASLVRDLFLVMVKGIDKLPPTK